MPERMLNGTIRKVIDMNARSKYSGLVRLWEETGKTFSVHLVMPWNVIWLYSKLRIQIGVEDARLEVEELNKARRQLNLESVELPRGF